MRLLPGHAASRAQMPRIAAAFSNALIAPPRNRRPRRVTAWRCSPVVSRIWSFRTERDTADVLLANGCAVDTPPVQPCCGSLHAHNGDLEGARVLARRMIDLFPPDRYDAIVSNAGGCGSHLRRYAPLLADDAAYRDRAHLWDRKVRDIQEWLVEIACRPPAATPSVESAIVTYHDSFHSCRPKISRDPRALCGAPGRVRSSIAVISWCCAVQA